MYLAQVSVLNEVDTQQALIAGLIPMDCPPQVSWHQRGLINFGGTVEQARYATEIAKEICDITGVQLRQKLEDLDKVIRDHQLVANHI